MILDLDAIKARRDEMVRYKLPEVRVRLLDDDIPALIARVRELEAALHEIADWDKSDDWIHNGIVWYRGIARAALGIETEAHQ